MASRHQQLGGYCAVSENLDEGRIRKFAECGGRWIVPVLHQLSRQDDPTCIYNQNHFSEKAAICKKYGVAYGSWFNGWGGDPNQDAQVIINAVRMYNARPVVLDLEAPYQQGTWRDPLTGELKQGEPDKMPQLLKAVRSGLPTTSIMVSTNAMNASMIFNGRNLTPARSFYDLSIRCHPQWYSWVYKKDGNYSPVAQMNWLRENGHKDFNFVDPTAPFKRGLPLSYVHGTLEVTGLEGADLADEIEQIKAARCVYGWSIYKIENTPDSDWPLIAAERGRTFLV